MRSEAAEREWQQIKRESPASIDMMRWAARRICDASKREDPAWIPCPKMTWYLKSLDIDDEYIQIKPHCFVTVRMPRDQTIGAVYKKVTDLKYTWLEGAEAVLEGFGSNNPHCHFLLPRKMHKGNLVKQLSNRFRVQKHFVDYKSSDCPQVFATRTSYIRGTKTEGKASGVSKDVEIRNANNIPHLITF